MTETLSTWYLLVVTVGLLHSQTHDWVLWGGITEAGTVLTSPAVSRVGIKIWRPQRCSVDTSWAWSQKKCLSPPLSTPPFSLLHNHKSLVFTVIHKKLPFSFISLFYFSRTIFFHHPPSFSPMHPSSASAPSSSVNPSLPTSPSSSSSHLQILSSDTTLIFCQLFFPPWTSVSVAQ